MAHAPLISGMEHVGGGARAWQLKMRHEMLAGGSRLAAAWFLVCLCLLCALCRRRLNYAQSVNQEIVASRGENQGISGYATGALIKCVASVLVATYTGRLTDSQTQLLWSEIWRTIIHGAIIVNHS